jgi:chaperonin GroES
MNEVGLLDIDPDIQEPNPIIDRVSMIGNQLLVEPSPVEERVKNGIILPDTVRSLTPPRGVVVAAGNGVRNTDGEITELHVKEGDEILYRENAKLDITIGNRRYHLITERDVICVLMPEGDEEVLDGGAP